MVLHQMPNPTISDRIKIFIIQLLHHSINLGLWLLQRFCYRRVTNPSKVLVFRTGSIGDSICAMPAMANIRANFPTSTIHLLTNSGKGHVSLVSIEKLIAPGVFDRIINYENLTRQELIQQLKAERYDAVIQLPQYYATLKNLVRDTLFFRLFIHIKSGFGWYYSGLIIFKKTQEKYGPNENERDRLNKILSDNGLKIGAVDEFSFQVTQEDIRKVNEELANAHFDSQKHIIGIVTGSKRPQNRWPLAYFEQVANHLSLNYNILFIGGGEDCDMVNQLLYISNSYSCCGRLTPIQSGLMMRHCTTILTNDTGPMHLAYSLGSQVLAIFSCRDFPYRWYPPANTRHTVLRADNVPCSICFSETCLDNICMKKIKPEQVIEVLEQMLKPESSHQKLLTL
jgi:ADP-heptose:LPS heptosyltransferase